MARGLATFKAFDHKYRFCSGFCGWDRTEQNQKMKQKINGGRWARRSKGPKLERGLIAPVTQA